MSSHENEKTAQQMYRSPLRINTTTLATHHMTRMDRPKDDALSELSTKLARVHLTPGPSITLLPTEIVVLIFEIGY